MIFKRRHRRATQRKYAGPVIRIELDEPTLARTRIAVSPLWETVCSLMLLDRAPGRLGFPCEEWEIRARTALASPECRPLRTAYLGDPRDFPDVLCPPPLTAMPSIEEELDVLRAAPAGAVEAELRAYNGGWQWLREAGALERVTAALKVYWDRAMAPFWPGMRAVLEEEVLNRARALAAAGPDLLLAGLHDRVRWESPVLTLVKREEADYRAEDKRLLLIPLIFSRGALMCSSDRGDVIAVSYQARGSAVLAGGTRSDAEDGLALLLGRGRAQVLRALGTPATTAGLAASLGLAPSTISEHLSVLVQAGVAYRRRAGRRVLYGLEPAGLAMVSLIGSQHSALPEFISRATA
jgi:DNA-binding transcriptional ArsR family regulator